tara:strand:- start:665 stop:913 length:249 start_codon:yes stop_codon:yes gene_type:complete
VTWLRSSCDRAGVATVKAVVDVGLDQDGFSWVDSVRSVPGQSGCANSGGVGVIRRQSNDCDAVDLIWFESSFVLMLRWVCSC